MKSTNCIENPEDVNWEKAWQKEVGPKKKQKKHWDKNTNPIHFEKIAIKDEYHDKLMPKLILNSKDTVLDLGSGEGAVTSLIAENVAKVTALDSSEMMLELLKQRCEYDKIDNIEIVEMDIEDANIDTVGKHDIVIASRALMGIHNIKNVLMNINELANKYVFLIVFGRNNWLLEKKFYDSIDKKYPDFAPYDYLFNLLISLRIYPNIENFNLIGNRKYDDLEDAFIRMKWKLGNLSDDEKNKIKPFIEENLFKNEDDRKLENPIDKADLVLMWWKK